MIFVFSEDNETAFEILAKGRELADSSKSKIAAISFGDREDDYIACGADMVFSINTEPHEDSVVEGISQLIDQYKPEILLIGSTKSGREVAPRIGQRFGAGCATDCIDLSKDNESLIVKRFVLGGRFIATQRFLRKPQIGTVPPRRFEKNMDKSRKGEIIKISFKPAQTGVQVMETKKKAPLVIVIAPRVSTQL